jgi:phenylacetate-coenzyme A ligase PaaK-like adenylate-forming protein
MLRQRIFSESDKNFDALALEVFRFQYTQNEVYRKYCDALKRNPENVNAVDLIPFLPIEFFKTHHVYGGNKKPETIFTSSGTTGQITSKHEVADLSLYEESFRKGFHHFYGKLKQYSLFALLPSYLERADSSLVYMAGKLIDETENKFSGFYLHDYENLSLKLQEADSKNQKILLLGVTYALLDLAEQFPIQIPDMIVLETGGMKGRRKEMVREELHSKLTAAFGLKQIHSEYGMTELLSQAYSKGDGIFECPPWMKIQIREMNDPFSFTETGKTGGVNIIDLANIYSCSFIASSDLGKKYADGRFEILGRFDHSDLRGCNLMVE